MITYSTRVMAWRAQRKDTRESYCNHWCELHHQTNEYLLPKLKAMRLIISVHGKYMFGEVLINLAPEASSLEGRRKE